MKDECKHGKLWDSQLCDGCEEEWTKMQLVGCIAYVLGTTPKTARRYQQAWFMGDFRRCPKAARRLFVLMRQMSFSYGKGWGA